MKKVLYILSLMLLALLPFANSVNAQSITTIENWPLYVYRKDVNTGGEIKLFEPNDYKQYFTNVNLIKRVDDKTILLKTQSADEPQIRMEVDKGQISCCAAEWNKITGIENCGDGGQFRKPIEIKSWRVNKLNKEDKDITIYIYHHKTNKLLGQMVYKLKSENVYIYTPRLHYFDMEGNDQVVDWQISELPINYDKTMRLDVEDGWGNSYKVSKYNLVFAGCMDCNINSYADTLSTNVKNKIKDMSKGKRFYIIGVTFMKDSISNDCVPIEFIK